MLAKDPDHADQMVSRYRRVVETIGLKTEAAKIPSAEIEGLLRSVASQT
jgi:hypothetical protein